MVPKIAIVGNGQVDRGCGVIIDACDLIVRLNDCRSVGEAGVRTDVVAVCSTGRPALSMVLIDCHIADGRLQKIAASHLQDEDCAA